MFRLKVLSLNSARTKCLFSIYSEMFNNSLFQERFKNFKPEPLVPVSGNKDESFDTPIVKEHVDIVDLAKVNFLNFLNNDEIKKVSEDAIRQYGMGTCGPRSFFGTTDIHLELENCLSTFLGMTDTAIYAYGFVALSTAFNYCFEKDKIIFIDEEVNFPIQQSVKDGRSKTIKFGHNDAEDLRQKVLQAIEQQRSSSEKFILILEAISWNTGKMCPLPDFLAVAEEFKIRVFLEESYSLGVLGLTGRGLTEYFDVDPKRIDCIFGTFEGAFGSIGGFCSYPTGSIAEIQRYRSAGYLYSASSPTYLAKMTLKALELLEDKPQKIFRFARSFHSFLKEECGFNVVSDPESPFKLIKHEPQENQKIHEYCKEQEVHFICDGNRLIVNLNISLLEDAQKLEYVYKVFKGASVLID